MALRGSLKMSTAKEMLVFSLSTLLFAAITCSLAYLIGQPAIAIVSVLSPALIALLMTASNDGKKGIYEVFIGQTFRKIPLASLLLSLLTVPLIAALAILIAHHGDISALNLRSHQWFPQLLFIVVIALGEEYGWRAYLLPKLLERFDFAKASILLGLVWGVWHFPAYLIGAGVPKHMSFAVFLLWVVLGSVFMAWIYIRTRSVVSAILIHISVNTTFNYLLLLPEFTGSSNTFWLFLALFSLALAGLLFVDRQELRQYHQRHALLRLRL